MRAEYRQAFTLVELLVVIAIIGILVGMIMPAVQATREAANRIKCTNQIRQLTYATINHQSSTLKFPAGIAPVNLENANVSTVGKSWLVTIFPMIEQGNLSEQLNASASQLQTDNELVQLYEDASNKHPIPLLLCPSSSGTAERATADNRSGFTAHYIGNAGPAINTVANTYNVYVPASGNGPIGLEGIFSPFALGPANSLPIYSHRNAKKISDVIDGLSNTILIGESSRTATANGNFVPHRAAWAFGGQGQFDAQANGYVPSELYSIRSVGANRINESRDYLANPNERNSHGFNSNHPGGAVFAAADGSTRFVSDLIEINTLIELSSIAGRELNQGFEE